MLLFLRTRRRSLRTKDRKFGNNEDKKKNFYEGLEETLNSVPTEHKYLPRDGYLINSLSRFSSSVWLNNIFCED